MKPLRPRGIPKSATVAFPGDPSSAVWRAYVASTAAPSRSDYLEWLAANRY